MRAAGMAYADNVKAQGKQHNLGSPHLYVWAALVKQLSQEQDLSPELTTALQQHIATIPNPVHLQSIVRHCRLSKAWASGAFKLQVAMAPSVVQIGNLLNYHLQVHGAIVKHGIPPRGHMSVLSHDSLPLWMGLILLLAVREQFEGEKCRSEWTDIQIYRLAE
ncbi:unnamed protein product [Polarella glacialis]|uniref:Uncharacterized protein n=1 Tax=Polarella glacialis TaxID=89957 RepID=A0A813IKH8_POLGL|nr:unnamed protein product [Polarella glacialis]